MEDNVEKVVLATDFEGTKKQIILYKYITCDALKGLLEYGDIKLTYQDDANDPFECSPRPSVYRDARLKNIGIISFTTTPNNHPMWGNYADKFRGACVKFVFDYFYVEPDITPTTKGEELALESIEYKKIGSQVYFLQYREEEDANRIDLWDRDVLVRCYYSKERSMSGNSFCYVSSKPINSSNLDYVRSYRAFNQKLIRQISTKHPDWSYEDEYRITMKKSSLTRTINCEGRVIHLSNKLTRYIKKIILGPLSEYNPEDLQAKLIENHSQGKSGVVYLSADTEIVKAQLSEHSFELIIP